MSIAQTAPQRMEKSEISTQLAAANQRLLQKRTQILVDKQTSKSESSLPLTAPQGDEHVPANLPKTSVHSGVHSWSLQNGQTALMRLRQPTGCINVQDNIHPQGITNAQCHTNAQGNNHAQSRPHPQDSGQINHNDCLKITASSSIPPVTHLKAYPQKQSKDLIPTPFNQSSSINLKGDPQLDWTIRIAPTLAGYMLDPNHRWHNAPLFGAYRLYSALRGLDQAGRGWLDYDWVKAQITQKNAVTYLYGSRRFKEVLARGEGLFWHRTKVNGTVRIRLVARYKIAEQTCGRLRGQEVVVTLQDLIGIGSSKETAVKAELYATIQAGLRADPWQIGRDKKQTVTGCSPYRQRAYEQRTGIAAQRNIQVIGLYSQERLVKAMFAGAGPVQSNVVYKHIDKKGVIDRHRPGAAYVVRLLPNTYRLPEGMFSVVKSRRQRTMNRQMDDLCMMSDGGSRAEPIVRVFHDNARQAYAAQEKHADTLALFPVRTSTRIGLWYAASSF